jgi:phosphoglycolate phosphatase-like HAD superfamily hydrolase
VTVPELIVLDLDGTLVWLDVDWDRVRAEVSRELASRNLRAPAGVLAALRDLDARREHAAGAACRQIVTAAELRGARSAPVNRALLRWLCEHAPTARLAVLTLNDRRAALEAIERLGLRSRLDDLDVIGRDDAPPKPAPDGLLALLVRHGIPPERALLIGDSDTDLQCARAAGVPALHVAEIGTDWVPVADGSSAGNVPPRIAA